MWAVSVYCIWIINRHSDWLKVVKQTLADKVIMCISLCLSGSDGTRPGYIQIKLMSHSVYLSMNWRVTESVCLLLVCVSRLCTLVWNSAHTDESRARYTQKHTLCSAGHTLQRWPSGLCGVLRLLHICLLFREDRRRCYALPFPLFLRLLKPLVINGCSRHIHDFKDENRRERTFLPSPTTRRLLI